MSTDLLDFSGESRVAKFKKSNFFRLGPVGSCAHSLFDYHLHIQFPSRSITRRSAPVRVRRRTTETQSKNCKLRESFTMHSRIQRAQHFTDTITLVFKTPGSRFR